MLAGGVAMEGLPGLVDVAFGQFLIPAPGGRAGYLRPISLVPPAIALLSTRVPINLEPAQLADLSGINFGALTVRS